MKNPLICIYPDNDLYKIALCCCNGLDQHYTYPTATQELTVWEVGQMMCGN